MSTLATTGYAEVIKDVGVAVENLTAPFLNELYKLDTGAKDEREEDTQIDLAIHLTALILLLLGLWRGCGLGKCCGYGPCSEQFFDCLIGGFACLLILLALAWYDNVGLFHYIMYEVAAGGLTVFCLAVIGVIVCGACSVILELFRQQG